MFTFETALRYHVICILRFSTFQHLVYPALCSGGALVEAHFESKTLNFIPVADCMSRIEFHSHSSLRGCRAFKLIIDQCFSTSDRHSAVFRASQGAR